jgi:cytochrome c-type biogenesis protein
MDTIFTTLTEALGASFGIALAASFAWGILSVLLSPCHLTSIPLIVGYISSREERGAKRPALLALVFALGILITIAVIGAVTAGSGRLIGDVGPVGRYFVAAVFLVVGLYLLGVVKLPDFGFSLDRAAKGGGLTGALLLGLVFGVALGPCTFAYMAPVLGIVFQVAGAELAASIALLLAFGIGHCAVIASAGMLTGKVQAYLDWSGHSRGLVWIKRVTGVLVLLGGVYYMYTAT